MSFEVDGFFAPEADRFREMVRATEPFKTWFDYALGLNRMGFDLLKRAGTPVTDPRLFAMHAHFVRVHQSFQSSLLLAERGLIPDARTVLRSGVEGAISLHALGRDPGFVDQMIAAHHLHQRKVARIILNTPDYMASYSSSDIAAMHAAIAEADRMEAASTAKLQDINWADVAANHCPDLYQLLYRSLSSDGTHATINSLNRFVVADTNMRITAFKAAPDTLGLVEALSAACLLFIWAADPFASAYDRPDVSAELSRQIQIFAQLPGAFPGKSPPGA